LMSLVASLTTEFMMTAAPLSAKSVTPTDLLPDTRSSCVEGRV
jgi:hypothetical protein